jgi:carbon storage regulator
MLVLTRRIGEEIMIASDIRVTVVAVNRNKVRLGITAPSSIAVARLELLAGCSAGAMTPRTGRTREN